MAADAATVAHDPGGSDSRPGLALAAFEATAFRFGVLPLSFLTTIITSRYLLPAGRGSFVIALLTVTLAWTLLCHVMVGVTREIGHLGRRPAAILTQGIFLALGLGIAGAAVLVPLNVALAPGSQKVVAIAAIALPAMLVTANIGGALMPLGRFRAWNVMQLLPQAFVVISMFVLVVALGKHLAGAVVAWVIAQIAVAVVAMFASRDIWMEAIRDRNWLTPNRLRPMIRLGLAMGAVNLVGVLNYRIELFVLQAYRGLGSVGIYSVAASIAEFAWLPVSALATVATPAIVNSSQDKAVDAVAQAFRHTIVLTVGFAMAVGTAGLLLIPTVFGERFAGARTPLAILVPAMVVFAPTKILAVYLSSRLGRPGFQLSVAATSTILTAIIAAALIPFLGMSGAAIATCVGYSAGISLEIAMLSRFGVPLRTLVPRAEDLRAYRTAMIGAARWARLRSMK